MKRAVLIAVFVALLPLGVWEVWATDGPLTALMNLRVRTDENGYLMVSAGTAGVIEGPLTPMGNLLGRTDENGYLRVAIAGGLADSSSGQDFVSEGCQVAWESALTYRMSRCVYSIGGVTYDAEEQTVTLTAADGSNPRIDVLAVDNTEDFIAVAGTAAASPSEPTTDPGTQLRLSIAVVAAGATEPTVTNTTVYADNAGHAAEWDCTNSGASTNCNSTNNPRTGTKDIEVTAQSAGHYAQLAKGGGGTLDITSGSVDRLVFHVRSKASWAPTRGFRVQLLSSGVIKGAQITIRNIGTYGFDSSITGSYQQIVIPVEDFAMPAGQSINQIRLVNFGGSIGYYVDDVVWQDGGHTPSGGGITQDQADQRYVRIVHAWPPSTADGRLTLETAVPVSTTDQAAKSTVYYTPYVGNKIALYDGTNWIAHSFTERSIALSGLTSGANYDVFAYSASGTVTLELSAVWTNDTTRADALTRQDGVYVKSGATTRRHLGTLRTTSTTATEDSAAKRFLWNRYNQRLRRMANATETTDSWTYSTATYRQANNNTANQLDYVTGDVETVIDASVIATHSASNASANPINAIGLDSTTTVSSIQNVFTHQAGTGATNVMSAQARYQGNPGLGRHFLAWLERPDTAVGTITWYGDGGNSALHQSAILGAIWN